MGVGMNFKRDGKAQGLITKGTFIIILFLLFINIFLINIGILKNNYYDDVVGNIFLLDAKWELSTIVLAVGGIFSIMGTLKSRKKGFKKQ